MNSNEMIDRYVNEVGENLPRKMRADIEMELRSLLLDALEERAEAEPSAKETAAFLQEFGSPETIAAQYRPAESLIGPKLFPVYKVVVTITVSIIGVLHLLWLGLVLWGRDRLQEAVAVIQEGIVVAEADEMVLVARPHLYWSYYRILQAAGQSAAALIWLHKGQTLLTEQAASLPEPLRESFLQTTPPHRQIMRTSKN